jgi:hypothetical protein
MAEVAVAEVLQDHLQQEAQGNSLQVLAAAMVTMGAIVLLPSIPILKEPEAVQVL